MGDGSTTFNLPDLRGRTSIGKGTGSGLSARTIGATGGEETHTLTTAEIPSHTHSIPSRDATAGGAHADTVPSVTSTGLDTTTYTNAAGSGGAHNNMQPFLVTAWIIKYTDTATSAIIFSDAEGDPADVTLVRADGTSIYAARRDHAHALDVSIAPTWTGAHIHTQSLTVRGDGAAPGFANTLYWTSAQGPAFAGYRARGSLASPAAVQDTDVMARFSGRGFDGSTFEVSAPGRMDVVASETHGASAAGTRIEFYTTPNASTTIGLAATIGQDKSLAVIGALSASNYSGTVSGGGTLATGGFTLTVPATGTAALTDRVGGQTFSTDQTIAAYLTVGTNVIPGAVNMLTPGAPVGVFGDYATFNGQRDDRITLGYNVKISGGTLVQANAGEPYLINIMEGHYYNGVARLMEWNYDYHNDGNTVSRRFMSQGIDRTTHKGSWRWWGGDGSTALGDLVITEDKTLAMGGSSGLSTNRLTILGLGTTSGTYGLAVTKSNGDPTLYVRDDAKVGIGTTTITTGYTLDVAGGIHTSGAVLFDAGGAASAMILQSQASTQTFWQVKNNYNTGSSLFYNLLLSFGVVNGTPGYGRVECGDDGDFRTIAIAYRGGNVTVGGTSSTSKFQVSGLADQVQSLVIGHTTQSPSTPISQIRRNDAAAGVSSILGLTGLGSGADGDGGLISMAIKSSTTAGTAAASIRWLWSTATHASRKAKMQFTTYDTAERIGLALEADGAAQDVYFEGGDGSGLPYGSCYGNEIGWTQASAAQNTWYIISDADMTDATGGLNLVTHDGSGKLTVTKAGHYLVNYSVTLECSALNKHVQTGISINGTVINDAIQHYEVSTPNAQLTISSTAVVKLAASGYVEIAVRTTDTGTPDLSVDHLNFSIVQVGG